MGSSASTGESGANAAISEAIRQWAREQLVDEVERINAAREADAATVSPKQRAAKQTPEAGRPSREERG